MSARACSFYFGAWYPGFVYDHTLVSYAYEPGGIEEIQAIASAPWRYFFPVTVVEQCRRN